MKIMSFRFALAFSRSYKYYLTLKKYPKGTVNLLLILEQLKYKEELTEDLMMTSETIILLRTLDFIKITIENYS